MNFKIIIFLAALVGLFMWGFYWYYTSSQARIEQLNQEKAILSESVKIQTETISFLEENFKKANEQISTTNKQLQESRQQNRQLVNRLANHDIGFLAYSRPNLLENIVNNASQNAARCFEILSGAEFNEREKNAKTSQEANSECPWLFDFIVSP